MLRGEIYWGTFFIESRFENEFKHPNAEYFEQKFTKEGVNSFSLYSSIQIIRILNFNSDKVHNVAAAYHQFVQQPFKPPPKTLPLESKTKHTVTRSYQSPVEASL